MSMLDVKENPMIILETQSDENSLIHISTDFVGYD